ncbi:MAG: D-amino-acid transaminase [Acetobacteraceae bacterium]|nr:D-amino-acid transaminase [Acetobacteraceae bacterium]
MARKVFLNGDWVDYAQAVVPVEDRGLMFADGIYEVIRVYNGKVFQLGPHLDRLFMGAAELRINLHYRREELERILARTVEFNGLENGGLYLQVTRGVSPRGHAFPAASTPTVFALTHEGHGPPARPGDGRPVEGSPAITAPDNRFGLCYVKTVGLLPNVLARQQAQEAGAREAILVRDGLVTEASSSNVFAVIGGTLYTHPLANILPGITRDIVLRLAARLGIPVREIAVPIGHLRRADEVFITGTMTEVEPVVSLDGRPVADGKPGPVTLRLFEAYVGVVEDDCGRVR